MRDHLVDRDCCLLDGHCKCITPWEDCKYLNQEDARTRYFENYTHIKDGHIPTTEKPDVAE